MPDDLQFDVLVLGSGPAGMAAATAAARAGARTALVDDNPEPGGQIWRGEKRRPSTRLAAGVYRQLLQESVRHFGGTRVVAPGPEPRSLLAEFEGQAFLFHYNKLILAAGARERFLPFPGWTLPNVTGAGGLQALVKSGLSVAGKRVVVAGSGPLLLAVASVLKKSGAELRLIAEQAPARRIHRFATRLLTQPSKWVQAARLKADLIEVPYRCGCWPVEALGEDRLEAVRLHTHEADETWTCDYLACGFGLVPNLEWAWCLGCCMDDNGQLATNTLLETSLAGVYAAGEINGIGGVECALVEGRIAGLAAAGQEKKARRLLRRRRRARRFAMALEHTFRLQPELRLLPDEHTIVCRCEDVTLGEITPWQEGRSVKLQTRCGMGPCQGRICGPALQFQLGYTTAAVRPPVFPVPVGVLAAIPPCRPI